MACRIYVLPVVALVLWSVPAAAKNDIRGVETGRPLAEALDTLVLDGARCPAVEAPSPEVCTYDEHTTMTLYFAKGGLQIVRKIVYSFPFTEKTKVADRLRELYGLREDRIEGEHRLSTGERLLVDLDDKGVAQVSIVNDKVIEDAAGH